LERLLSEGYDAIAVSVIDDAQKDILKRVAERAKLITLNSDDPDSRRLFYVGTNHYEVGKALGFKLTELLSKGDEVAVFISTLRKDSDLERFHGLRDVLGRYSIKIVEIREDDGDSEKARKNVERVLKAHPDIDLLAGLSAHEGAVIAAVLRDLHRQGQIQAVAVDDDEGTLRAIEQGSISYTVSQSPVEIGYVASKWVHELSTKPSKDLSFPKKNTSPLSATQVLRNGIWTNIELLDRGDLTEFKSERAERERE
jgi:ribose transport system substrate-binding protein